MGKHVRQSNRGECLRPTSVALLATPLVFIHEDHLRERQICVTLDAVATGAKVSAQAIGSALDFLTSELPLHLQDEEEDLFPLLKRRCLPEDEIGKIIARLLADHRHAVTDVTDVIDSLETVAANARDLHQTQRDALAVFAEHSRRHLLLENAVILPFARLRLTPADLETLEIRMRQRRGLHPSAQVMT